MFTNSQTSKNAESGDSSLTLVVCSAHQKIFLENLSQKKVLFLPFWIEFVEIVMIFFLGLFNFKFKVNRTLIEYWVFACYVSACYCFKYIGLLLLLYNEKCKHLKELSAAVMRGFSLLIHMTITGWWGS